MIIGLVLIANACSPACVSTQPFYQEGFRPQQPSSNYVWVDGNWIFNRPTGTYSSSNGYWSLPYRGRQYQSGQWRNNR